MDPTPSPSPASTSARSGLVTTLFVLCLVCGVIGVSAWIFWWPEHQRQVLMRTGVETMGQIIKVEPTGSVYNDQPQVKLTVRVRPAQGEEFVAETKMIINQVYIPQFQPGTIVHVYYDQKDHSKIAISTDKG